MQNHGLLYNQQFRFLGLEMMRKDENRFPSTVFLFFEDHVPHCKLTCFWGGRDEVVRKFWVTGLQDQSIAQLHLASQAQTPEKSTAQQT